MHATIKPNKSDVERLIECVRSVVVYHKYQTRLGEMIIFSPRLESYQFSQLRYIFLINGNTIHVFSRYPKNLVVGREVYRCHCVGLSVYR